MVLPMAALLKTRVEVASWLTVTLNEPLMASAVVLAESGNVVLPVMSMLADLALIVERFVSVLAEALPDWRSSP